MEEKDRRGREESVWSSHPGTKSICEDEFITERAGWVGSGSAFCLGWTRRGVSQVRKDCDQYWF